jgi:hypothetical protein
MTDAEHLMHEIARLGGEFTMRGDEIVVEYPDETAAEVEPILGKLSARKDEVRSLLCKHSLGSPVAPGCPPLPRGVRLKSYAPKSPPILIAPWSVVTDVEKFIASYLRDLDWRLKHPRGHAAAPLPEILSKLAEVGLELQLESEIAMQNNQLKRKF